MEVAARSADPFVNRGKNPYSETAIACDAGHPHHHGARRDTTIKNPAYEDPVNYKSREDWQRALWKSKIDPDAKRYIKQLENTVVDGWEQTFDAVWGRIEQALDRSLPVTDELFVEFLTDAARKQVQNLNKNEWVSAFDGLYVRGKERSNLNGKSKSRKAQRVDTLEEQAVLSRLRQTALEKVVTVTRQDLRDDILEQLSQPGARAKSPTAIANAIIRRERARLEEATKDRELLKSQIRDLYDNQLWKIQRITRTEAANAYTMSVLRGYQEQGIQKVKWNSHTEEQNTCSICLSYDGMEFDIDELLSEGGRYPLSTQSHPQCRCWFTPIISHVTLEYMEDLYENEPELFAPGQTVFDKSILEMEDVVREYQEYYGVGMLDVPVENADEVKETLDVIRDTPYNQLQPDQLQFVKDTGATEEFQKSIELPEPILGQIVSWTSPENKLLISQFSSDDGNTVSSTIVREWAGRIYDSDSAIRDTAGDLFNRDADEVRPADINPNTIRKLLKVVEPHTMMRVQFIGRDETVTVEKRLREAPEVKLRNMLSDLGIVEDDIDTIIKWRRDRPVWDMNGRYIPAEGMTGSEHNRFVNRIAEQGPREMFIECCVAFVMDPHTLKRRDPQSYEFLKGSVFDGKEFAK